MSDISRKVKDLPWVEQAAYYKDKSANLQAENEALKAKLEMIEIISEFIDTAKKLKSEFESLLSDSTDGNYQPIINNLNDDNPPDEE